MLPKTKFNALCREIAEETDEAWLDQFYDEYLAAKFAEATIMEYAAHSYDNDALEYSMESRA